MMIEHLLQPGQIGNLKLKNRIIYSAMSFNLNHHQGYLYDSEINSLVYRAKQEYSPGLINFPGMNTCPPSKTGKNIHHTVYNDETMLAVSKAVEKVRINGCKVMTQCGGGKSNPGLGPSDMVNTNTGTPIRQMTVGEIQGYIEEVVKSAKLCAEAGFDALEIHASTGKFLSLFLSPYTNHRTDQYGGSVYNRARIVMELLQEMRKAVGESVALTTRLTVDELAGYLTIDDGIEIAKYLAPYLDAIQPSTGFNEFKWTVTPAYFFKKGYMLDYTQAIKEHVDIPVIAMGKLGNPALAEQVVASGKADFVCLGRPLFVDPEWITKAAKGEEKEILQCIGCVNCFMENDRREIYPPQRACTLNPSNLREEAFAELVPTEHPKKVLVAGGGLAGMEAAITLAKRGHHVTLCEKSDKLGGQWIVAEHGPEKAEYRTLIPHKKNELQNAGVNIQCGVTVDRSYLEKFKPEMVVLATGAVPKSLPVDENVKFNVVQGNDVIMGEAITGQRVVVIGGRFIGMEAAIKLAREGKHVSLVDMQEIGKNANPRLAGVYRNQMVESGVYLYPSCPIRRFAETGVEITHMDLPLLLPADTVVFAVGTKPVIDLKAVLEEMQIRHCLIGDCKRIGDALYAIRDGAEIGRLI